MPLYLVCPQIAFLSYAESSQVEIQWNCGESWTLDPI